MSFFGIIGKWNIGTRDTRGHNRQRKRYDLSNYLSIYILYDLAVILIQIIMVSPGTHLVKNHESQFKKKIVILHLWGYLCIRDGGR